MYKQENENKFDDLRDGILTASFFIRGVVTINNSVTHFFFVNAHFSNATMKMMLRTIWTIKFV